MNIALQPYEIRENIVKNRLFFSSMGLDMASEDGTFSDAMTGFYKGIIESGCGSVILGNATVSPRSKLKSHNFSLYTNQHAKSLECIANHAKKQNVLLGVQLQHYGPQGNPAHAEGGELFSPSGVPVAATLKRFPQAKFKTVTTAEIDETIHDFVNSALLAESAGVKLIQIQAGNGYLFSSFQSPLSNKRTDGYGGSAANRSQLLLKTIRHIRSKIKNDTLLGIRLGIDDMIEGGTVVADLIELIEQYRINGTDIIEVTVSTADTFHNFLRNPIRVSQLLRDGAKILRTYSTIPIAMTGLVISVNEANDLIENGVADSIGMVRALFADNDLILKHIEKRDDETNRCLMDGKCFMDKSNPLSNRVYCCINKKYLRPAHINYPGVKA